MRLISLYYYILQYSPVLPLGYALFHLRKLDKPLKLFIGYLTTSLFLTIVMTPLARSGQNNLWIMNISFLPYAAWILSMFAIWQKRPILAKAMKGAVFFFFAVWGLEIWLSGGLFQFTTYSRPLLGILFTACSCITIFDGNSDPDVPLTDQPRFWLSAGILLYFGGMLVVNLASQSLLKSSQDSLYAVIMIQPALNLVSNLFYFAGLRAQCRR